MYSFSFQYVLPVDPQCLVLEAWGAHTALRQCPELRALTPHTQCGTHLWDQSDPSPVPPTHSGTHGDHVTLSPVMWSVDHCLGSELLQHAASLRISLQCSRKVQKQLSCWGNLPLSFKYACMPSPCTDCFTFLRWTITGAPMQSVGRVVNCKYVALINCHVLFFGAFENPKGRIVRYEVNKSDLKRKFVLPNQAIILSFCFGLQKLCVKL